LIPIDLRMSCIADRPALLLKLVEATRLAGLKYSSMPITCKSFGKFSNGLCLSCLDHVNHVGVRVNIKVLEDHRPVLAKNEAIMIELMSRTLSAATTRQYCLESLRLLSHFGHGTLYRVRNKSQYSHGNVRSSVNIGRRELL
jgi:hypothetical protein